MTTPIVRNTFGVLLVAEAADLVITHAITHGLPEPVSLHISGGDELLERPTSAHVQIQSRDIVDVGRVLLAWADTLPVVAGRVWRVPGGLSAHVEINGSLAIDTGRLRLCVYAGMPYDPVFLPALEPGEKCALPLGALRDWTTFDTKGAAE